MKNFLGMLELGLKIFLFFGIIFFILRLSFIFFLREFLGEVTGEEIFSAIIFGARLSCQTSGVMTLIIFFPALFPKKFFSKIILALAFGSTIILSFAAIPFYEQFHSNFNQMIFAGLHDDFFALAMTFLQEFQLLPRLFAALIFSAAIYKIFLRVVKFHARTFNKIRLIIFSALTFAVINFSIFGGGWNWKTELTFENIGVTKNNLLNESILDSFQAIHRAEILQNRIVNSQGLDFTAESVKNLAKKVSGKNLDSNNLDDYLKKSAAGAKIPKPKKIFLIICESLPNWILLEKYSDLHMADGLKNFIRDGAYCPTFLPNGGNTISAVTGIVTGFADANLYLTTIPESYSEIFPTAAAPQMKRLGYETNFFYAGSATWEKISDFTRAQGFENFFGEGDIKNKIPNASGNVWGVDDKFLYEFVEKNLSDAPSFNVILNTSNHAPYTVDLAAEKIFVGDSDEEIKIGHQIYSERELCKFVEKIRELEPESLFVIVGDHADRFHVEKNPSTYERFCVPLIIFGCGAEQKFFAENCAGSQIDILPTIIELIAPRGFEYFSLGRSLGENFFGVNYAIFITRDFFGNANNFPLQAVPIFPEKNYSPQINFGELEDYINFVRGISFWRVKHGKIF